MRSFNAVTTKKDEAVALMIKHNLVTANTTDATGQTPLLAAVSVGNVRMVQELVNFAPASTATASTPKGNTAKGAAGSPGHRTAPHRAPARRRARQSQPRQALRGRELALRLAADNGHREIADFLPLWRGGGWRRWKTRHAKAVDRAKRAAEKTSLRPVFRVGGAEILPLDGVEGVC